MILAVCNFTPVPRHNYRVGVPRLGAWRELLNSDADADYGGSGKATWARPKPFPSATTTTTTRCC